jgi:hypothetical protein
MNDFMTYVWLMKMISRVTRDNDRRYPVLHELIQLPAFPAHFRRWVSRGLIAVGSVGQKKQVTVAGVGIRNGLGAERRGTKCGSKASGGCNFGQGGNGCFTDGGYAGCGRTSHHGGPVGSSGCFLTSKLRFAPGLGRFAFVLGNFPPGFGSFALSGSNSGIRLALIVHPFTNTIPDGTTG